MANLFMPEESHTTTEDIENIDKTSRASPALPAVPALPPNEVFSKEQTLFLIDLMRQHLDKEADGLPKTLKELNSRLKAAKSSKKNLWKDTAQKLSKQFSESFCPDRVARKWNTLVDGYKKVKDNMDKTGGAAIKFQFFVEMDDLIGGQHDVVFPVVGTSAGLSVRRPEVLATNTEPCAETASSSSTPTSATHTPTRPLKRRRDDILQFLKESEEESRRRHDELLAQLKSAQQGFEGLMSRILDKL